MDDEADHFEKKSSQEKETFHIRAWNVIRLTIPSSLSAVVGMFCALMNLAFIGYLNDPAMMAGVGLGNMTNNLCALSIILGFNSALDTLISQAAGAGNIELSGVYLN